MVEPVDLESSLSGCLDCNGGQPGRLVAQPLPCALTLRLRAGRSRWPFEVLLCLRSGWAPPACQQSLSELGALTAQRVVLGWRVRSEVTGSPLSPRGAQLFGLRVAARLEAREQAGGLGGLPSPHSPGLGVAGTLPCAPLPPVGSSPVQGRSLGPWARLPAPAEPAGHLGSSDDWGRVWALALRGLPLRPPPLSPDQTRPFL